MVEPTVFNGRYELHRRLGRGGMAEVFLARDLQLGRPVAVKVLFPQHAADPAFVERFRREAQAAANLNHPNIVSVYDWGEEHGTYFIVMEYVDGQSLADTLRSKGPLAAGSAVEVATDVAAALGVAHGAGVLHRDIKPGNILVTPSGLVKVADWGIGRAIDAQVEENLTQTGTVMGTATYFSPEQAQGLTLDNRSDLYALGVVLYEMVCGRPPFSGDSTVAIAYKHVQEPPTPPRQLNASIAPELEAIIMQLLEKRPEDRYADADDLRADLRRYREGFRVHAMTRAAAAAAAADAAGATSAVPAMDATQAVPAYPVDDPAAYDALDDDGPREKRSWLFLVVLLVLLAVLGGLLFLLADSLGILDQSDDTDVAQVVVPRVIDLPADEAREILEDEGFEVEEVPEQVADAALVDIVLSQNPENGIRVDEGSTVTITVGSQNTFPMPNLARSTPDQARNTLEGLGFTGELRERDEPSEDIEVGQIIATEPAAGEQVSTTATITLVISSGPPQTEVPGCAGETEATCAERLTAAGFAFDVARESSADVPVDRVIRTTPEAGALADNGATVRIVVSDGPAQATVPPVVGLTRGQAIAALEDAGFSVVVEEQPGPAADVDRVLAQNPPGNSSAAAGSEVRIVVGIADGAETTIPDVGD
jgi:beta-lactam-binding protein with PASTA domain